MPRPRGRVHPPAAREETTRSRHFGQSSPSLLLSLRSLLSPRPLNPGQQHTAQSRTPLIPLLFSASLRLCGEIAFFPTGLPSSGPTEHRPGTLPAESRRGPRAFMRLLAFLLFSSSLRLRLISPAVTLGQHVLGAWRKCFRAPDLVANGRCRATSNICRGSGGAAAKSGPCRARRRTLCAR